MGKSDENIARDNIKQGQADSRANFGQGQTQTQQSLNDARQRMGSAYTDVYGRYTGMADTKPGNITDDWNAIGGNMGGSGGGGGGGGGGTPEYDYLSAFRDMQGAQGGFDPTRMSNLTDTIAKLKATDKNFGATDTSITGLQNFAKTGGVSDADAADIQSPVFREFSATGGYSPEDIANMRARSNAGATSTYRNLADTMQRQRAASGNMGPGYSAASAALARKSAQDLGTNAANTELGIKNAINTNRMAGANALSAATQGLAGLRSSNTLQGYGSAGNLDLAKQKQISDALAASGGLDLNTQQLINNTRLAATGGLSQDALGRMSIGAQSAAANRAIDAANQRYLMGLENQQKEFGISGLAGLFGADQSNTQFNQGLLSNYINSGDASQRGWNQQQMGLAASPGWEQSLGTVLGGVGNFMSPFMGFGGGSGISENGGVGE